MVGKFILCLSENEGLDTSFHYTILMNATEEMLYWPRLGIYVPELDEFIVLKSVDNILMDDDLEEFVPFPPMMKRL